MSTGLIIQLRKKLKEAKARIEQLEGQQAQEILDLAVQHPIMAETVTLKALKDMLTACGETVQPHDDPVHKVQNIIAAKNSAMQQMKELMQTPASDMLKDALHVIINDRLNTPGMNTAAALFLQKPIIVALLKEVEAEKPIIVALLKEVEAERSIE